MFKKVLFISAVLAASLLLFGTIDKSQADASAQLEQADAYMKDKNYQQAETIYKTIVTDYPGTDYALEAQKGLTILYITCGRQPEAQAAYEKLLADFSGNEGIAEAVYSIADKYRRLKKYEKGREVYQYVVDNWPDSKEAVNAQAGLAISYIGLGDDSNTQAAFDKLLTEFSGNEGIAQAVYRIAEEYRRLEKYEKGREFYQYVVNNWPEIEEAMDAQARVAISNIRLGDDPNTQAAVGKLFTEFSKHKRLPQGVYKIAKIYDGLEKYEKARRLYQYVLDNWPDSEFAMRSQKGVAISNILLGDEGAAQAAIDKLLTEFSEFSENKRLPQGFYNIAKAYGGLGKDEKARELYQYVLDNWPDSEEVVNAQAGLAISYIGLGDDPNAQQAIDRLIADFNDHPDLPRVISNIEEGYYNRILAAETWVRENYRHPVIIWEKVLSEFPDFFHDDPDLYYFIACCYYQLGEYDNAIGYYRETAANWPDYHQAWGTLSLIEDSYDGLKEAGAIGQAEASTQIEQIYNEIIENSPTSISAKYACLKLGSKHFDSGQWFDAAYYFKLFWQNFPDDAGLGRVVYDLGRAYEQWGRTALAVAVYEEFLRTHPTDERIKARLEELKAANK